MKSVSQVHQMIENLQFNRQMFPQDMVATIDGQIKILQWVMDDNATPTFQSGKLVRETVAKPKPKTKAKPKAKAKKPAKKKPSDKSFFGRIADNIDRLDRE